LRRAAASLTDGATASSGSSLVGVKESPSAVPHDGHELLSSGISLRQLGQTVMGSGLYHHFPIAGARISDVLIKERLSAKSASTGRVIM
jgi:hypothetical protein